MINVAFRDDNSSQLSGISSIDSTKDEIRKRRASINVGTQCTSSRISLQISHSFRTTKNMLANLVSPQPTSREVAEQQSRTIDAFLVSEARKRDNHIDIVLCDFPHDWMPVMKQLQEEHSLPSDRWSNEPAHITTNDGLDIQVMRIPRCYGNLRKTWLPRIDSFYATLFVADIGIIYADVLEFPDEISKRLQALIESWDSLLHSRYLMHHAFIFFLSNSEVVKNKGKLNALPDYFRFDFDEKDEEEDAVLYIGRRFREAFGGGRKIAIRVLESSWTDEAVQGQLISAVKELRCRRQ